MKWTMRYAALLAALVLALGVVAIMRPGIAAADSDEVMLPSPGNRGDPDDGGGMRSWSSWVRPAKQSLLRLRSFTARPNIRTGPAFRSPTRQTWTRPR